MRLLLLNIIFIALSSITYSQIVFDKTSHDFGEIYDNELRYVDIYLKNQGEKAAYILSVEKPMEVVYIQKSAFIEPGASTVIRFHIDKRSKGKFSYSIPVYTSDKNEPTTIKLSGRINTLPKQNALTACPDFNQNPAQGNPLDFELIVETIDKETRNPVGKSDVVIIQNGMPLGKWKTNAKGILKIKVPLGISYFYATHSDYLPDEKGMYINFNQNHVVLELTREIIEELEEELIAETVIEEELVYEKPVKEESQTEESRPIVELEETPEISPEKEEEKAIEELEELIVYEEPEERVIEIDSDPINEPSFDIASLFKRKKKEKEEKIEVPTAMPTEAEETYTLLDELDELNFDEEYFDPINVVFVIDVSGSMRQYNRLDLLKYSLNQLTKMIRPQDKIALVSFADDPRVLLKTTNGDEKKHIYETVKELKAYGATDGAAGLKLGYKLVNKSYLKEGRNHVIIITDGAFNKSVGKFEKQIEKNLNRKDITLSVIGIKSTDRDEESMTEAALLGNGRFILIDKLEDAQTKLIQEIRLSSFKFK